MKITRIILCTALCCCISLSLASCFKYQEKWVDRLQDEFPDDTITYDGVEPGELGPRGDIADVSSGDYPDCRIRIIRQDGGVLITNYNYYRYKADIDEYFSEYLEPFFDCDGIYADHVPNCPNYENYTPIEDISFDRFLERYVTWNSITVHLFYEEEIPDDDQMKQMLIEVLRSHSDEPVKIFLHVYNQPATDDPDPRSVERIYQAYMSEPGIINFISVSSFGGQGRSFLVENMEI